MRHIFIAIALFWSGVSFAQEQKAPFFKRLFGKKKKAAPVWVAKKGAYNPEATKFHDLVHTQLKVSFDWEQKQLIGKATLTLKPHFYAQDSLWLDGKGFDIKGITVLSREGSYHPVYRYDQKKLAIALKNSAERVDTFKVEIDYVANPERLPKSGSGAITEDKGLYFINADGKEPNKPRQIWTQGETESASCWFPTIDHPNQKTTEEIQITVEDKYTTLSNGLLKASVRNVDGTRTDHWVHDKPHAPYLFMMAVGEFEVYKDKWRDMEVNYLMEKDFAPYAKKIFGNTPEMLEFFSTKLGVKYPWDKYSQVVVRDFVSGAMENTSAALFYEGLNVTDRQLLDRHWDGIIGHELFHHWFGDLVTCESWANIPLNEAFANYSEYLWFEHKYGKDEADHHRYNEMSEYLDEAEEKQEPLIRYHYLDKEEMFDNHSYNKGGCTLHMLRNIVGDGAFFESLKSYLNKNAFKPGEIHHLRLAFEEVTGQDMNWFFDTYFLKPGHMQIGVKHSYADGKLKLVIAQMQDTLYTPLYTFPVDLEIWVGAKKEVKRVEISKALHILEYPYAQAPDLVVFDGDQYLLGEILHNKSVKEHIFQYTHSTAYLSRLKAAQALAAVADNDSVAAKAMFLVAKDVHFSIRELALGVLSKNKFVKKDSLETLLVALATKDPKPRIKAIATKLLAPYADKYVDLIGRNLQDSAYSVVGGALHAFLKSKSERKAEVIAQYKPEKMLSIVMALSEYFIAQKDASQEPWYDDNIKTLQRREQYYFIGEYVKYYQTIGKINDPKVLEALRNIATSKTAYIWSKLAAYKQIAGLKDQADKKAILQKILDEETNAKLKAEYGAVLKKVK